MDKLTLIKSASGLKEVSPQAAAQFESVVESCAAALTQSMKLVPELDSLIGEGNLEVMETNHGNHFRYMNATTALYDPLSFVETVLWVLRTYQARGFSVRYWEFMLPRASDILSRHLDPAHYEEIKPFYDWLHGNVPAFARLGEKESSVYEQMGVAHEHER